MYGHEAVVLWSALPRFTGEAAARDWSYLAICLTGVARRLTGTYDSPRRAPCNEMARIIVFNDVVVNMTYAILLKIFY